MKTTLLRTLLGTTLLTVIPLSAASFNCHKASSSIEKAICADRYLSELDGKMGRLYHQAEEKGFDVRAEQRSWVSHRNSRCGSNTDCLYDLTEKRVAHLKRLLAGHSGGGKHAGKSGTVFTPANGVVCDRKGGFCSDGMGISMAYTGQYLGKAAQTKLENMSDKLGDNFDTSSFVLSNGIYCDTNVKKCYTSKYDKKVSRKWTNRLFAY